MATKISATKIDELIATLPTAIRVKPTTGFSLAREVLTHRDDPALKGKVILTSLKSIQSALHQDVKAADRFIHWALKEASDNTVLQHKIVEAILPHLPLTAKKDVTIAYDLIDHMLPMCGENTALRDALADHGIKLLKVLARNCGNSEEPRNWFRNTAEQYKNDEAFQTRLIEGVVGELPAIAATDKWAAKYLAFSFYAMRPIGENGASTAPFLKKAFGVLPRLAKVSGIAASEFFNSMTYAGLYTDAATRNAILDAGIAAVGLYPEADAHIAENTVQEINRLVGIIEEGHAFCGVSIADGPFVEAMRGKISRLSPQIAATQG